MWKSDLTARQFVNGPFGAAVIAVKSHNGGCAGNWQAIFRTDDRIRELKWLDVIVAALGTNSILVDQAGTINGRHKSTTENDGPASPIDWNNILR